MKFQMRLSDKDQVEIRLIDEGKDRELAIRFNSDVWLQLVPMLTELRQEERLTLIQREHYSQIQRTRVAHESHRLKNNPWSDDEGLSESAADAFLEEFLPLEAAIKTGDVAEASRLTLEIAKKYGVGPA